MHTHWLCTDSAVSVMELTYAMILARASYSDTEHMKSTERARYLVRGQL